MYFMYVSVLPVCMHLCSAYGDQKRSLGPLELGSQVFVPCKCWESSLSLPEEHTFLFNLLLQLHIESPSRGQIPLPSGLLTLPGVAGREPSAPSAGLPKPLPMCHTEEKHDVRFLTCAYLVCMFFTCTYADLLCTWAPAYWLFIHGFLLIGSRWRRQGVDMTLFCSVVEGFSIFIVIVS